MNQWRCEYEGCDYCKFYKECRGGELEDIKCDYLLEKQVEDARQEFTDAWWSYVHEYDD